LQQQLQAAQEQRDRYRDMVDGARQERADMLAEAERLRVRSDALQREVDALRNILEIERTKQQTAQLRESHDWQIRTAKEAQAIAQARFKLMMRAVRQLKHAVETVALLGPAALKLPIRPTEDAGPPGDCPPISCLTQWLNRTRLVLAIAAW
jgi:transcriptional regulator of heat shock response